MNRSLIALAAALAGIVATRPDDTGELPALNLDDHGTTVHLSRGEAFTITLEGNPASGFVWDVAEADTRVVALGGEPRFFPSGRLLGGGITRFRFAARRPGDTTVVLSYRRPWRPSTPLQTFRVHVVVT
jgi:inhibitor of cysteine peptidase